MNTSFHLSLPCADIVKTKHFYTNVIGASHGRNSENWIDINLFNNQITFTKCGDFNFEYKNYRFEGETIPSFHFGVVLNETEWNKVFFKLKNSQYLYIDKTEFLGNKKGEHISFFVKDPNGYIIEFKRFKNENEIFKT